MNKPKIQIILGSTRQERQGSAVATWFQEHAKAQPELDFEYLDLRDWELPFFGTKESARVEEWRAKIAEADGYVIVTPEYNHSFPAVLKNALDYGGKSFRNKPVAFVSYTASNVGAARAVEQLRLVSIELQLAPIREAIHLSGLSGSLPENSNSKPMQERLARFFTQLTWWAKALQKARHEMPVAA